MSMGNTSIKEEVIKKLVANASEIRERFGIETIGIFGSVARGNDSPESDVDIFYRFSSDRINYFVYLDLADYFEDLFGRKVDLVPLDNMRYSFRKQIEPDMILTGGVRVEA